MTGWQTDLYRLAVPTLQEMRSKRQIERLVRALERIADSLEKMQPQVEKIATADEWPPIEPIDSGLTSQRPSDGQ